MVQQAWLQRLYDKQQARSKPGLIWWGRLVATHQIPVLLAVALVVCLVLSSAVVPFLASASAVSSTHGLRSLLSRPLGAGARPQPVALPWEHLEDVVAFEGEPCWSRLPRERLLAVQQVWLTTAERLTDTDGEHGVLDRSALHKALRAQAALEAGLADESQSEWQCVADETGRCVVTSPLNYWNTSEATLLSDATPLATIGRSGSLWSSAGLPLSTDSTLIGRTTRGSALHSANLLALTTFSSASSATASHDNRLAELEAAAGKLGRTARLAAFHRERHIVLRRFTSSSANVRTISEQITFALVYLIVGLYVYIRLRSLDRVHFRPGLVFTGLVQTVMSGLLSLRVCSALGLRLEVVPWQMLPFLVVVLGVDNIFLMSQTITATSVELSLPDRVSQGFARIGFPLFLTFLVEISMTGLAFLLLPTGGGWRELSGFSSIALVTDYLLQASYFLTVLSIDMQRLELADLLSQGSNALTSSRTRAASLTRQTMAPTSSWVVLRNALRHAVEARLARTYTFTSLVLINIALFLRHGSGYLSPRVCGIGSTSLAAASPSTSEGRFWNLLSGSDPLASIHVIVRKPIIIVLGGSGPTAIIPRSFLGQSGTRILRDVLLPTTLVVGFLYLLLSFLLKDADVLASEKARAAKARADEEREARERLSSPRAVIGDLRILSQNDIEVTATSRDACISWSAMADHLVVTHLVGDASTRDRLPLPSAVSLSALAIDHTGTFAAAATIGGSLLLFSLATLAELPTSSTSRPRPSSVVALFGQPARNPATAPPPGPGASEHYGIFYAVYADGALARIDCRDGETSQVADAVTEASGRVRSCFVIPPASSRPFDGHVVLRREAPHSWAVWTFAREMPRRLAAIEVEDGGIVTSAAAVIVPSGGTTVRSVALGLRDGRVLVFRLADEVEQLCVLQSRTTQRVRRIRLAAVPSHACRRCSETIADAISVSWSAGPTLLTKQIYRPAIEAGCHCWPARAAATGSGSSLPPSGSPSRPAPEDALVGTVSMHGAGRRASHFRREASNESAPLLPSPPVSPRMQPRRLSDEPASEVRVLPGSEVVVDPDSAWDYLGRFLVAVRRRRGGGGEARELGSVLGEWELVSIDHTSTEAPSIIADSLADFGASPSVATPDASPSRRGRRRDPLSTPPARSTARMSAADTEGGPFLAHDLLPFGRARLLALVPESAARATLVLGNALAVIDGSASAWPLLANGHGGPFANGSTTPLKANLLSTPTSTRKMQ